MARRSDPAFADTASINRFFVWPNSTDEYDHDELAENWDRLDAILGRPANNAVWPPTQGLGGGIYAQINLLMQQLTGLGTVDDWWFPFNGSETAAQIESLLAQAKPGYAVCDGRQVLSANHDFDLIVNDARTNGDIWMPDLRNCFIMGASTAKAPGTASAAAETLGRLYGTASSQGNINSPASNSAPGAVRSTSSDKQIGKNSSHYQANVNLPIPDHLHDVSHGHALSGSSGDGAVVNDPDLVIFNVGKLYSVLNGEMRKDLTAVNPNHDVPPTTAAQNFPADRLRAGIAGTVQDANGTGRRFISLSHRHGSGSFAVGDFTDTTSTGARQTGNRGLAQTMTPNLTWDNRPQHVGMLKVMKVKLITAPNNTLIQPT